MRGLWAGLALMVGLVTGHLVIRDPPLRTTDPARIDALYREVLGDDVPRPTGSAADERAVQRIHAHLEGLGYAAEIQRGFACAPNGICAFAENVVARWAGTSTGAVLVAAHHDTVPASPGGYDDGAGVVALLEIARILRQRPPLARAVVLLFSDAEELALNGARVFDAEHRWARGVDAMMAIESMGGPSTLHRGAQSYALQGWARDRGLTLPPFTSALAYLDPQAGFDADVFEGRDITTLVLTGIGDGPRYHTPLDRGDDVDDADVAARTDIALGLIEALAQQPPDADRARAASFVVPLLGTLVAPERALMGVGPLAFLGVVALALRRCARRPSALFGRAAVAGLAASAATGAGVLLLLLLRRTEALPGMWIEAPLALGLGLTAGMGAAMGVVARLVEARIPRLFDPWATLVAMAAVGAALGVVAPAGAHLAVVPAALGALVTAAAQRDAREAPAAGLATALAVLGLLVGQVAALSWLVNMGAIYVFLAGSAATAAVLGASVGPIGPRALLMLLAGCGAGILGSSLAARSGDGPLERVSVRYHQDLDHGAARWLVTESVPPALAEQAAFTLEDAPFAWWPQAPVFVASATVAVRPPAPPTLTGTTTDGRFRGALRSPAGAWMVSLALPPGAPVGRVWVGGREVQLARATIARAREHRVFSVVGARTATIGFEAEVDGALEVELIELDPGLPEPARGLSGRRRGRQVPAHVGDAWMRSRRVAFP